MLPALSSGFCFKKLLPNHLPILDTVSLNTATQSADLPWLNYSAPSPSPLGVFLFSHQNRCILLEEKELTGAGDGHECSSAMCQQHSMTERDSSTSCLLERPVGLKSCFWVNKCWNAKVARWISAAIKPIFPARQISTRRYKRWRQTMETKLSANKHNDSQLPAFYSLGCKTLSYRGIRTFKRRCKDARWNMTEPWDQPIQTSSEIACICSQLVHLWSHCITLVARREAESKSSCPAYQWEKQGTRSAK